MEQFNEVVKAILLAATLLKEKYDSYCKKKKELPLQRKYFLDPSNRSRFCKSFFDIGFPMNVCKTYFSSNLPLADVYYFTVCQAKLDLAFIIDGSGSIEAYGKGNFKRCLNFVKRMVVSFKISKRFTRVGVVLFSYRPRLIFSFNSYSRKRDILRAIDKIKYPKGGTKTGLAISYAQRVLFRRRSSSRKRVMLVMTDGRSQDRVSSAARALKGQRVQIFAVGIGKRYNINQLFQIASSRRHVYTAGFKNLPSIVKIIKTKACSGKRSSFL